MQENKPYVIGKHRKITIIKWKRLVVATFLLCFAVCIIVCVAAQGGKHITLDPQSFYFLQMGEYSAESDAKPKALEIQFVGGAGYVLNDVTYKVMANVYFSKEDSLKVCARLNTEGKNAIVFSVSTPKIKIKDQRDAAINKLISDALYYPITQFKNIFNVIIQLDKSQISKELALKEVNNYKIHTQNLINEHSKSNTIALKSINKVYENMNITLQKAEESSIANVSCRLKYILCELAATIIDGYNKIQQ